MNQRNSPDSAGALLHKTSRNAYRRLDQPAIDHVLRAQAPDRQVALGKQRYFTGQLIQASLRGSLPPFLTRVVIDRGIKRLIERGVVDDIPNSLLLDLIALVLAYMNMLIQLLVRCQHEEATAIFVACQTKNHLHDECVSNCRESPCPEFRRFTVL